MRANQSSIGHETQGNEAHRDEAPQAPEAPVPRAEPKLALWHRAGVRQLAKFCLVGASSTILDQSAKYVLFELGKKFAPGVPWQVWFTISFCLAVTNGYFWNRKWTFQATSEAHGSPKVQYQRFVVTNGIGLLINLFFAKLFLIAFTGQVVHKENPETKYLMLASLCAVPIVVIWNFCAAKFWTFKPARS